MGETATIYALIDPRTDEVRYIGQTTAPLEVRLRAHIHQGMSDLGRESGAMKGQWIQELDRFGLQPQIKALQEVRLRDALKVEAKTIIEYLNKGANLINAATTIAGRHRAYQPMVIGSQVSEEVYFALMAQAKHAGMTLNTYVRHILEQATIPALPESLLLHNCDAQGCTSVAHHCDVIGCLSTGYPIRQTHEEESSHMLCTKHGVEFGYPGTEVHFSGIASFRGRRLSYS